MPVSENVRSREAILSTLREQVAALLDLEDEFPLLAGMIGDALEAGLLR